MPRLKGSEEVDQSERIEEIEKEEEQEKEEDESWTALPLRRWLESVDERKKTQWLVDQLIPERAIVLLSGHQKKAKKTWLADMLAICLATGKSYGKLIALSNTSARRVLYFQEEGQDVQTKLRLLALCKELEIDWSNEIKLDNVSYSFQAFVRVNKEEWKTRIRKYVREHKPDIVIFDGLSFIHDVDENSKTEMAKVVDALREIRNMGAAVLCLAHLDKSRGDNPEADMDSQVRGSSLIAGAYDSHIALRKYDDDEEEPITIKVRQRSANQREGKLRWSIKATDCGDPDVASFKFWEGDEDPIEDDLDKYVALLGTGVQYSIGDLRSAWKVHHNKAKRIVELLLKEGTLSKPSRAKYELGKKEIKK